MPHWRKTKTYFLIKTIQKHFFKAKDLASQAKRKLSGLIIKKIRDPRHQSVAVNQCETINILLFNNAFMIGSMIILTVTVSSNFNFKFKRGFTSQFSTYHLPLAEENDSFSLLTSKCTWNYQQHKLKPKIIFDRSFLSYSLLVRAGGFRSSNQAVSSSSSQSE